MYLSSTCLSATDVKTLQIRTHLWLYDALLKEMSSRGILWKWQLQPVGIE